MTESESVQPNVDEPVTIEKLDFTQAASYLGLLLTINGAAYLLFTFLGLGWQTRNQFTIEDYLKAPFAVWPTSALAVAMWLLYSDRQRTIRKRNKTSGERWWVVFVIFGIALYAVLAVSYETGYDMFTPLLAISPSIILSLFAWFKPSLLGMAPKAMFIACSLITLPMNLSVSHGNIEQAFAETNHAIVYVKGDAKDYRLLIPLHDGAFVREANGSTPIYFPWEEISHVTYN